MDQKKLLKRLAFLCMLLSFFGLWQSLSFHIDLIYSTEVQREPGWLFTGVFLVWFPAVLAGCYLTKKKDREDVWEAIFQHCPTWMKFFTNGLLAYAFTNVIYGLFMISSAVGTTWSYWHTRNGSGITMSFYGVAAVIFYAFLQSDK